MQEYDRSSKWLIQHHGDSILRLAGLRDIVSWRPLQAEVVQPRQLPDGLLEVKFAGSDDPTLFVLELATYPDARIARQAIRNMALVYLGRDVIPELLVVVLHPKGNLTATPSAELVSIHRWSRWRIDWKVVDLWTVPAEELLAAGDVGLVPWIPLSRIDGPPEPIFQACRARIDLEAPEGEHENLLAVTQVLAGLRYNDPNLFRLLGGREAMIESPVLQELKTEWTCDGLREAIFGVLSARFGDTADAIQPRLSVITEEAKLKELVRVASTCVDLSSFIKQLES